jgi:hypothetical protein
MMVLEIKWLKIEIDVSRAANSGYEWFGYVKIFEYLIKK